MCLSWPYVLFLQLLEYWENVQNLHMPAGMLA